MTLDRPLISDLLIALFVSGSDCGQPAYIRPTDCMLFVSGSDSGQPAYIRPTDCMLCPVVSVDSPLISDLLTACCVRY